MAKLLDLKKWLPFWRKGVWLQFLPLFVMFCFLWGTAQNVLNLLTSTVKFWEYVAYGWIYGAGGYLFGLAAITKFFRVRWPAAIFAVVYLFLYAVNIGLLHSAGVVLVPFYVRIASATNWFNYFTPWLWLVTGIFLINAALAVWLIWKYASSIRQVHIRGLGILLIVLWALPLVSNLNWFHPSTIISRAITKHETAVWLTSQTETLRMVANNPVVILNKALFTPFYPLHQFPEHALEQETNVIQTWHLALGARNYSDLGLKPFKHIIVFATESLSLDFLAPYNSRLPRDLSPFYGSSNVMQAMFTNYQTVSLPTQPGLSVTYNSHPNARALRVGQSEASLVKLLNANGYETYVLMACSETFLNNKTFFTKLGFQHVLGVEEWEKDPAKKPFIEHFGLMDRLLYSAALNLLETNQNKKIYIHVANADTHGPIPRDYFGSLEYPPVPDDIKKLALNSDADANAIFAGIFRHDFDIGLTFQRMQERGLMNDDTLVVLMADHNFPPTAALKDIPNYSAGVFHRIPLAFFSGQPLPPVDKEEFGSQIDFAPTMAHLLNLPVPAGWWGQSLFETNLTAPYVRRFNDKIIIKEDSQSPETQISMSHPANPAESNLINLFQTLYFDSFTNQP